MNGRNRSPRQKDKKTDGKADAKTDAKAKLVPEKKPTQADLIVCFVRARAELFCGDDDHDYISMRVGDDGTSPLRTMRISSSEFRKSAAYICHQATGRAPSDQALRSAILTLEGIARHEGDRRQVFLRVGGGDTTIYLDLGDDSGCVEIDAAGWRVVSESPVPFIRSRSAQPLPIPQRGGSLDELKQFVRVDEARWILLVCFLVCAFRVGRPFWHLILTGVQGAAKSMMARLLRRLVDPSRAELRREPKNARDLAIAAANSHLLVFDNVSSIPPWLSDGLCCLSTGGAFATRELYQNDQEIIFEARRPVIITSITDVARAPDLLERSLLVPLDPVKKFDRRTEAKLEAEFAAAHPRILGALLDWVSAAIRNLSVTPESVEFRMADAATWAVAAGSELGLSRESILEALRANEDIGTETALEACPIIDPLLRVMGRQPGGLWCGTAKELLDKLNALLPTTEGAIRLRRLPEWPQRPRGLTALLQRIAPALPTVGIRYVGHNKHRRTHTLELIAAVERGMPESSEADEPPVFARHSARDGEVSS